MNKLQTVLGSLILLAITSLFGLYWGAYCRAAELEIRVAVQESQFQEIIRRLERIERKLD